MFGKTRVKILEIGQADDLCFMPSLIFSNNKEKEDI